MNTFLTREPMILSTIASCNGHIAQRRQTQYSAAVEQMVDSPASQHSILHNFNKSNVKAFAIGEKALIIHRQTDDGREQLFAASTSVKNR